MSIQELKDEILANIDKLFATGAVDVILWKNTKGPIESRRAGSRTHETIWGSRVKNSWRGLFNDKSREITVMPPAIFKGSSVPQRLLDKLEDKFGTGLRVWKCNPIKPKRVR